MGRRLFHWSGLCVVAGVMFCQRPAEAGEHKVAVVHQKSATANASVPRTEITHAAFFPKASTFVKATASEISAKRKDEPARSEPATRAERKSITLFRFRTQRLGEVSVQPVVGGVNGAQLSIGF